MKFLKRFLKRLLSLFDKAFDVIIWIHDCLLLYICLAWLLPLVGIIFCSWFFYDLKPLLRGRSGELIFLGVQAQNQTVLDVSAARGTLIDGGRKSAGHRTRMRGGQTAFV